MKKVKLREDIKIPKMSQNNVNSNCVPENGGRGGGQNGPPAHSMVKECVSLAQLIIIKARLNGSNMLGQHHPTLLATTCCLRLNTMLGHVGQCWIVLEDG